jgi:uncharacterized Ntn-hydrolase superfamily protein
MTYSLLSIDEKTGALVAAAATGIALRGRMGDSRTSRGRSGGFAGHRALDALARRGAAADGGWRSGGSRRRRDHRRRSRSGHRQLAALDPQGGTAGFTGDASVAYAAHVAGDGMIVAGNMLSGPEVLDAMREGWTGSDAEGDPALRALAALDAAERSGGDARGLLSAALLVLRPDAAPLDLRIDRSDAPLRDLRDLLGAVRTPPYADWLDEVPTELAPTRAPGLPRAAE